ncbi:MAG: adenylate/guanylate cyclase domain-containing protein, partial [Rhodobacterales bacterium]|nr:adenylate/guanylate cyclase domain-containing protein [Rhodobacterales bacterium]
TAEIILKQENEKLISLNQEAYDSLKDKNAKLEKISNRLAKYLSPQIYKNIFESDSEHTNEYKRKKLTVFFSDIKGFTDLSDSLDPDLLAELVNDYLSAMTDIALKHGGTIDKFIGDAILVFFGDPESDGLKKDASKCLSMAIAMQNKVAELDKSWREDHGIAEGLKVRIGISTGYCTVGNFGSVQRVDYTVLGSTVNLASRLESICQPQKILVAPETKVLLEKDFKFRAQESVSLKGFNQPVVPYEYINLKETTSPEILKGNVVDIILKQPKDIESILHELKSLQKDYEDKLTKTRPSKNKKK